MTLKNIPLPATILANLYKYSLTDLRNNEKKSAQKSTVPISGGSNKRIHLLVDNADTSLLPGNQLSFLSDILIACKLSMADIEIINLHERPTPDYKHLPDVLHPQIIILSGIELSVLQLPFNIPPFQAQMYKDKRYVHIPSLDVLQNDTVLKRKLWELLKVLFLI